MCVHQGLFGSRHMVTRLVSRYACTAFVVLLSGNCEIAQLCSICGMRVDAVSGHCSTQVSGNRIACEQAQHAGDIESPSSPALPCHNQLAGLETNGELCVLHLAGLQTKTVPA